MTNRFFDATIAKAKERVRLRELGITVGRMKPGKLNAITDVKGVKVAHVTLIEGSGKRKPGKGPIRTGVTVISPNDNIFNQKLMAGSFILNGAGEMAGITQVNEWGVIETPIALTNTMNVGRVSDAINEWMARRFSAIWSGKQVVIPVVGECDDSFLNDSAGQHVKKHHVFEALDNVAEGAVEEGSVGAGTGMVCCDFKGGIGTSSRIIEIEGKKYTLGVLVLSNFGEMEDLRINGFEFGGRVKTHFASYGRRRENYGSIITVVATDLPVSVSQIQRICKRAALGIGRVGSYAAYGSGEIVIGFSTANVLRTDEKAAIYTLKLLRDNHIDLAYEAAVEATEEAILNSLTKSVEMEGVEGNRVPALPLELLAKMKTNIEDVFG